MNNKRWLLPNGIEELLPPMAGFFEKFHRDILDLYKSWGYQLLIPPFVEHLDSLLVGAGSDVDLDTFKLIDPVTGKLIGLRADMTPQAARVDAHQLSYEGPVRLCYLGTVLKATQDPFGSVRNPTQVGVELFGHSGIESDAEVIQLAHETLKACGIENASFDLGHIDIFRGLISQTGLATEQIDVLFDAIQRKAIPEITELLDDIDLPQHSRAMLLALPELSGDQDILVHARTILAEAPESVHQALDYLANLLDLLDKRMPGVVIHLDLAELRGYHYHTGIVFAGFISARGAEVVRGGRYDGIGEKFGRTRPATGFSADLKQLVKEGGIIDDLQDQPVILAPANTDQSLQDKVMELRNQGYCVIWDMPDSELQQYKQVIKLVYKADNWMLETAE